jgi:hypothetical protein
VVVLFVVEAMERWRAVAELILFPNQRPLRMVIPAKEWGFVDTVLLLWEFV